MAQRAAWGAECGPRPTQRADFAWIAVLRVELGRRVPTQRPSVLVLRLVGDPLHLHARGRHGHRR
jgi:hypothetical protein